MIFFRKHQKFILLLMVALMVLFLVPSACSDRSGGGLFRGGKANYMGQYTIGGKVTKIEYLQTEPAHQELDLLDGLGLAQYRRYGLAIQGRTIGDRARQYTYGKGDRETGGLAWHLWTVMLADQKIQTTEQERTDYLKSAGITNADIDSLAAARKTTVRQIATAVDHLVALNKMTRLAAAQANSVSTYKVQEAVKEIAETALVDLAIPNLDRFKTVTSQPSEKTLADVFEKNKDRLPGGDEPGYKIPDQVSIEMLVVDALDLVTPAQAKAYYLAHPDKYTELVPSTQPASQPSTRPGATQPTSQSEPELVRRVKPLTDELMQEIRRELVSQPDSNDEPSPRDRVSAGLKEMAREIAAAKSPPSYAALAAQAEEKTGAKARVVTGQNLSQAGVFQDRGPEVNKLLLESERTGDLHPVFLQAFFSKPLLGGRPVPEHFRDFQPIDINEQRAEVFTYDTQMYLWRLTAAIPEHAPKSLDEVRAAVTADATAVAARELARIELGRVEAAVKAGQTLPAAAEAANKELSARPVTTRPASQPASQPDFIKIDHRVQVHRLSLYFDREVWDRLSSQYQGLPPQAMMQLQLECWKLSPVPPRAAPSRRIIDVAFDLAEADARKSARPNANRAELVNDPASGVLALISFVELTPATTDDLRSNRAALVDEVLRRREASEFQRSWFDIRTRISYQEIKQRQE